MPFMRGVMPLRRTYYYMEQGKIIFRNEVKIFTIAYHRMPNEAQKGASDFVYWHWNQLLFKNPEIQFVRQDNISIAPFAIAFLGDGREVPFDLEWMTHQEIGDVLRKTLGKSTLVRKAEELEKMAKCHPADFGENCQRQCICEVQGQHPCTSLIYAPKHISESWRCDHENYDPEKPTIYPKQKFVDSDLVERDPPGRQ
ncbi:unnamed protein product [Meloidogyne enterolobii]|uniref:Uncharacterized protein n=1 Tax=Meloidogyne enterolobii TaxID=390850 RepID=A0ACB0YMB9_MELEN